MSALPDVITVLLQLGLEQDPEQPNVLRKRLFARPEADNNRKQDLEVHLVKDEWHEGVVLRSVVALVKNVLALSVISRYRDVYGSVGFQAVDDNGGYLTFSTHIPLAPFTLSDPTAMVNFISEFIGRADKLEEVLLGGADVF